MNQAKAVKLIQLLSPFRKRGKRKRAPRWAFPDRIEESFARALEGVIEQLEEAFNREVLPHLGEIISQASNDSRQDDWADDLERYMRLYRVGAEAVAIDTLPTAQEISQWNVAQWRRITKSVVGVEVVQAEPWLEAALKDWAAENKDKITKLTQSASTDVGSWVRRGVREGRRAEDIAADIRSRFEVSKSYAKMLARDQVGKLNGNLTQARQTRLGVTRYIWRTAGDDRVRETHQANDGKTFSWDDPPKTGHPGQDYQCRCFPEPDLSDLLAGLQEVSA